MKELLRKIGEVYDSLIRKEQEASRILADVQNRESAVASREKFCTDYESAQAVLEGVRQIRRENEAERERIKEERIKFDNLMREERQAIASEITRLQPLRDQEKQLFDDRQALYERERQLEKEKKEFKARYIEKIKQHFKNTGGEPNPDEIT